MATPFHIMIDGSSGDAESIIPTKHPWKQTNVPLKGTISKETKSSSNHHFSGDIFSFQGDVMEIIYSNYKSLILAICLSFCLITPMTPWDSRDEDEATQIHPNQKNWPSKSSWWFQPRLVKNESDWIISQFDRGENSEYLKPPRNLFWHPKHP